jgi:negative regulator of sigma E activity
LNKQVTDKLREQVSALMDGELPEGEHELLLRRFAVERSLRLHWERCHIVGEAMRKDLATVDLRGFADRVMAELSTESVTVENTGRFGGTWTRAFAGGLVAASVAVVAVLGLRHDPRQSGLAPTEIVPTTAVSGEAPAISPDFMNSANWSGQISPAQAALRSSIVEQDDVNSSLTMQGLQPYRYIPRPAPRRPTDAKKPLKDAGTPRQP